MQPDDLLIPVLDHLAGHGLAVVGPETGTRFRGNTGTPADATLTLKVGDTRLEYAFEAKRALTATTLGAAVTRLRHLARTTGRPALLVTDYLAPPLAEKLKEQGQQFADAAGNAYIQGANVLVWVCGRPRPEALKPRPAGAFAAAGIKLLFALLRDPALAARPQRHIAGAAGVALGTVPGVLRDLADRDHLVGRGKRRRLVGLPRLLDEWTQAYGRTLYPRTLLRTLTAPDFDGWETWDLAPHGALWGAEPAARLLVGHLHPGELTLYVRRIPGRLLAGQRMTEPAAGAIDRLVRFRQAFWGETQEPAPQPPVVHPLLVYADLLATGDGRCIETAEIVREKHLAGLLESD